MSCKGPWTGWAWLYQSELLTTFKMRKLSHFQTTTAPTNDFQLVLKDLAGLGPIGPLPSGRLPGALTQPQVASVLWVSPASATAWQQLSCAVRGPGSDLGADCSWSRVRVKKNQKARIPGLSWRRTGGWLCSSEGEDRVE